MKKRLLRWSVVVLAVAVLAVPAVPSWRRTMVGWVVPPPSFCGHPASYWAEALGDNSSSARSTLRSGGAEAVAGLVGALRGGDSGIRGGAAAVLGQIGPDAHGATGVLGNNLQDEDLFA